MKMDSIQKNGTLDCDISVLCQFSQTTLEFMMFIIAADIFIWVLPSWGSGFIHSSDVLHREESKSPPEPPGGCWADKAEGEKGMYCGLNSPPVERVLMSFTGDLSCDH